MTKNDLVAKADILWMSRVSEDFLRQLAGWGLTTAEILYRMPDHQDFIQSFIWQHYDVSPDFPVLKKFLIFWRENLDGPLVSVHVGHERLIRPAEIRMVGAEFLLH